MCHVSHKVHQWATILRFLPTIWFVQLFWLSIVIVPWHFCPVPKDSFLNMSLEVLLYSVQQSPSGFVSSLDTSVHKLISESTSQLHPHDCPTYPHVCPYVPGISKSTSPPLSRSIVHPLSPLAHLCEGNRRILEIRHFLGYCDRAIFHFHGNQHTCYTKDQVLWKPIFYFHRNQHTVYTLHKRSSQPISA